MTAIEAFIVVMIIFSHFSQENKMQDIETKQQINEVKHD